MQSAFFNPVRNPSSFLGSLQHSIDFKDKFKSHPIDQMDLKNNVDAHLTRIRLLHGNHSPVIKCQKVIRGWYCRQINRNDHRTFKFSVVLIQRRLRGYLFRLRLKRELAEMLRAVGEEHLLLSIEERHRHRNAFKIQTWWKDLNKTIVQDRAVVAMQRWFRRYRAHLRSARAFLEGTGCQHILFSRSEIQRVISAACDAFRIDSTLRCLSDQEMREYIENRMFQTGYSLIRSFSYLRYEYQNGADVFTSDGVIRIFRKDIDQSIVTLQDRIRVLQNDLAALTRDMTQIDRYTVHASRQKTRTTKHIEHLQECCAFKGKKLHAQKHFAPSVLSQEESIRYRRRWKTTLSDEYQHQVYEKVVVFCPPTIQILARMMFILRSWAPAFSRPLIYFERQILRLNAAIQIQSAWRAFHVRETIGTALRWIRRTQRAAVCIQRFWKFHSGLGRRFAVFSHLLEIVASITSPTVFIEEQVLKTVRNRSRFLAALGLRRKSYFKGLFRNISFDRHAKVVYSNHEHRYIPSWFPSRPRLTVKVVDSVALSLEEIALKLLEKNVVAIDVESSEMVRLTFTSVEEARKRFLLLACLTYDPTNHTYLHGYSHFESKDRVPSFWHTLSTVTIENGTTNDFNQEKIRENAKSMRKTSRKLKQMSQDRKASDLVMKHDKIHQDRVPVRPAAVNYAPQPTTRSLSKRKQLAEMIALKRDKVMQQYQERKKAATVLAHEKELITTDRQARGKLEQEERNVELRRLRLEKGLSLLEIRDKIEKEKHLRARKQANRTFAMSFGRQTSILSRHIALGKEYKRRAEDLSHQQLRTRENRAKKAQAKAIFEAEKQKMALEKETQVLKLREEQHERRDWRREEEIQRQVCIRERFESIQAIRQSLNPQPPVEKSKPTVFLRKMKPLTAREEELIHDALERVAGRDSENFLDHL